jgi:hypothetical protein
MYREVSSSEFKNKEILLRALKTNSLSLRMTRYVYEPEVKYESIYRIRNNFKITTIGYFD